MIRSEPDEFTEFCDNNDIVLIEDKLNSVPALSFMDEGECAIVIDERQFDSVKEYNTARWHEAGHCMTCSFYTRYSGFETRDRCEYRANKWAIKKLLPIDEMIDAMKRGIEEVWQLSDYFDVSEELVKKAFWIYFDTILE